MDYQTALNLMLNKQSLGIMPGLSRILKLLDKMDNPQDKTKVIHIAGTNGKGTVANTISNGLIQAGYHTGLFTSPWILDYREQIQLDGNFISEERFSEYVEEYIDCDCTEFELLTAIMYKYFADEKVDYAVVECGMGGTGDATNVEKENLSVITSVSLDHTNFLGDTIAEIAAEKSGIIRQNSTCILYPNPESEYVFENVCKQKNTRLIKIENQNEFSLNNLETAKQTLRILGLNTDIELVRPLARQSRIKNILIDGGHNADAAKALLTIPDLFNKVALIGMMRDKDVEGYLSLIAPRCKKIYTTASSNPRSISAAELKSIAEKYCVDVVAVDNHADAVTLALQNGLNLICGSFYLIREIINLI